MNSERGQRWHIVDTEILRQERWKNVQEMKAVKLYEQKRMETSYNQTLRGTRGREE